MYIINSIKDKCDSDDVLLLQFMYERTYDDVNLWSILTGIRVWRYICTDVPALTCTVCRVDVVG